MAYFAGVNTDILHHTDLIYSTQPVRTQTCGLQNVQCGRWGRKNGAEKLRRCLWGYPTRQMHGKAEGPFPERKCINFGLIIYIGSCSMPLFDEVCGGAGLVNMFVNIAGILIILFTGMLNHPCMYRSIKVTKWSLNECINKKVLC